MGAPLAEASSSPAGPAAADKGLDGGPDRRFLLAASVAGAAVTGLACLVLHLLSLNGTYGKLTDALFISPFWSDASLLHAGLPPYHGFALEYPPLSLAAFILPAILPGGGLDYPTYRTMFELLMTLCAMGLVPITAWTIARVGGTRAHVLLGIGFLAVAPLLLGPITISRYDLWPALLTAAAMLAMVSSKLRLGFALLALGALAKVYPVFLVPIFAWYAWRTAGAREAAISMALAGVVGLLGLAPFLAVDVDAALGPFTRTLARPLQVESLGASILTFLHGWVGLPIGPVSYGFDSYNLTGVYTADVTSVQLGALIGSIVVATVIAAMGRARPDRFALACTAVLALTVALGKVLSPQYAVWLIAGVAASASLGARPLLWLGAILVLTQIYFPARYDQYLVGDIHATVVVLERNVALVILALYFVAVTWRLTRLPAPRLDRPGDRAPAAA